MHGNTKHGKSGSVEYRHWEIMKRRCFNPNHDAYPYYGGHGITVEEPWKSNFMQFLLDMGPCPEGFTIERLDNNGNYCKSNCEWQPKHKQQANRRSCIYFEIEGERVNMREAAKRYGLIWQTVQKRLKAGDSHADALRPVLSANGK